VESRWPALKMGEVWVVLEIHISKFCEP